MTQNSNFNHQLVIERSFDAPRELVWKAWTDAEQFKKWYGPESFTCPAATLDLRVGGRYLANMRSADGRDFWMTGEFVEIDPPNHLVLTESRSDAEGHVMQMGDNFPTTMKITLTFSEENGKTVMRFQEEGLPSGDMANMVSQGWNGAFNKLANSLA